MGKVKKVVLFILISLLVAILSVGAVGCSKKKKNNETPNGKSQDQIEKERFEAFSKFLDGMDVSVSKAGQHKVDKNGVIEVGADVELKIGNSTRVGTIENAVETVIKTKAIIDRKDNYKNSAIFASIYNKSADKNVATFSYYFSDLNTVYLEFAGQKVAFKFDAGKYTREGNDSYVSILNKILEENEWLKDQIASKLHVDLNDKSTIANLVNAVLSSPISKHFENLADAFGDGFTIKKALNSFIKDLKIPNKNGEAKTFVEFAKETIGGFGKILTNFGIDVNKIINNNEIDFLEAIRNKDVSTLLGIETKDKTVTINKFDLVAKFVKQFNAKDRVQVSYEDNDGKLSAIGFAAMLHNYKVRGKAVGIATKLSNITVKNYETEATKENMSKTFGLDLAEYKEDYKIESEQEYTLSGLKADLHKFSKVFPEGTVLDTVANEEKITVKAEGTLDLFNESNNKTAFVMEVKNSAGERLAKVVFHAGTLTIESTGYKVGGVEANKILYYASIHAIKSLLAVRTNNATFNANVQNLAKDIAKSIFANIYNSEVGANADPDAIVFNKYTLTAEGKAKKEFFFGIGTAVKTDAPKAFMFMNIDVVKIFRERFIAQEDSYKIAEKESVDNNFINLFSKLGKPSLDMIPGFINKIKDFNKDKLEIENPNDSSIFGLFRGILQEDKDKAIAYSLVNLKGYVDDYYNLGIFENTFAQIKEAQKIVDELENKKDKNENEKIKLVEAKTIIQNARNAAEKAYEIQKEESAKRYDKYKSYVKNPKEKAELQKVLNKYGITWLENVIEGTNGLENGMKWLINKTDVASIKAILTAIDGGLEEEYTFEIVGSVKLIAKRKTTVISGTNTDSSGPAAYDKIFNLANLTA